MGKKVDEALDIAYEDVPTYLHAHHSMYMEAPTGLYYLTDVNDRYWRVQDTRRFNEKGHYIDCSPLVPTIAEFLELPYNDEGHTIKSVFAQGDVLPVGRRERCRRGDPVARRPRKAEKVRGSRKELGAQKA